MDDEPLILEIDIKNDDAANKAMSDLAKTVKTIQAPVDSASDSVAKLEKNLRAASGPADRLTKAILQLQNAQMNGSSSQVFDAQHNFNRANKAYGKAQNAMNPQPPEQDSLMKRLGSVLSSSRFSVGGGGGGPSLMPLVGQTLKAIGPEIEAVLGVGAEMLAGPIGIAVAAIALMSQMANAAAESLTAFKDSMVTSGGSGSEVAKLNAYGAAAGVSDTAGLSRQLADKLAGNGQAAAFGQQAGIHDFGGAYSDLDKAKNLQKAIDYMLDPRTSDVQALRFARVEGLEAFVKMRGISADTLQNLDAAAALNDRAHSPQDMKNAAEFNAQLAIASTNFDTITTSLGSSFIPLFTDAIALFNDFAPGINSTIIALKPLIDLLLSVTPAGMLATLHKEIEAMRKMMDGGNDKKQAEQEHTEALKEHAAALKNGTYGGGNRARGALPAAWGGSNAKNWDSEARKLGAL